MLTSVNNRNNFCCGLEIEGHQVAKYFKPTKKEFKNFFRENQKKIRKLELETKQNKEFNMQIKDVWKSSKYDNVESKLKETLNNWEKIPRPKTVNENFLKAHSLTGLKIPFSARPYFVQNNKNVKIDSYLNNSNNNANFLENKTDNLKDSSNLIEIYNKPHGNSNLSQRSEHSSFPHPNRNELKINLEGFNSARETNMLRPISAGPTKSRNFIKLNGQAIKLYQLRRAASSHSLTPKGEANQTNKSSFDSNRNRPGEIPQYLSDRKKEWQKQAEESEKMKKQKREIPEGHRLMPESERLEALEQLLLKRDILTKDLFSLPIRSDTLRIRNQKEDLEKKLAKLDEAVKILTRNKVYIKIDSK